MAGNESGKNQGLTPTMSKPVQAQKKDR